MLNIFQVCDIITKYLIDEIKNRGISLTLDDINNFLIDLFEEIYDEVYKRYMSNKFVLEVTIYDAFSYLFKFENKNLKTKDEFFRIYFYCFRQYGIYEIIKRKLIGGNNIER